jgi:hypothetical protein
VHGERGEAVVPHVFPLVVRAREPCRSARGAVENPPLRTTVALRTSAYSTPG